MRKAKLVNRKATKLVNVRLNALCAINLAISRSRGSQRNADILKIVASWGTAAAVAGTRVAQNRLRSPRRTRAY